MLLHNNKISTKQLTELELLLERCKACDGNNPPVYPYILLQKRRKNSNTLLYENKSLIGFLGLYYFSPYCCEVSLFIDPNYRQQQIATELLRTTIPNCLEAYINELQFSVSHPELSKKLPTLGFKYDKSEYRLARDCSKPSKTMATPFIIQRATIADLDVLCMLETATFSGHNNHTENHFKELLENNSYHILIAYKNSQPIAKAHLHLDPNNKDTVLSDIGVIASARKQGCATAMINSCLNIANINGKERVLLDVETNNKNAVSLYLNLNFTIENSYSFWNISRHILQQKIGL